MVGGVLAAADVARARADFVVNSIDQAWPLDSAVLAVHAKHAQPGNFPYSFGTGGKGPALQTNPSSP